MVTKTESPGAKLHRTADPEQFNKPAFLDLPEVRASLKRKATEFASRRATPTAVVEVQRPHDAVERDVLAQRSYFRTNTAFHKAIAVVEHNPVLVESIQLLISRIREYRKQLMDEIMLIPCHKVIKHQAILIVTRRRDPDRAREAMVAHIRSFAGTIEGHGIAAATAS